MLLVLLLPVFCSFLWVSWVLLLMVVQAADHEKSLFAALPNFLISVVIGIGFTYVGTRISRYSLGKLMSALAFCYLVYLVIHFNDIKSEIIYIKDGYPRDYYHFYHHRGTEFVVQGQTPPGIPMTVILYDTFGEIIGLVLGSGIVHIWRDRPEKRVLVSREEQDEAVNPENG
ncbi:MAG: hypothetical protein H7145_23720 [Akkermansiaceae bacterium]|nr:hypothetical protein [Armatimonadota bacterium]